MNKHDWQQAPPSYDPPWKEMQEDLDPYYGISSVGVYTCARCGDEARIYVGKRAGDGAASPNWNSDCDESVVRNVHAL